jgi:hypothetical protein
MSSPFIWQGSYSKSLKDWLNLNSKVYVLNGTVDPTVVAQNAPEGSIYLRYGGNHGAYIKNDAGNTTNWDLLLGSSGNNSITQRQEVAAGVVNGVNVTFTTTAAPLGSENLEVYIDGLILPDSAWSLAGSTITLTTAPTAGQDVYVVYFIAASAPITGRQETPAGVTNGVNTNFVLSTTPVDANNVEVFLDGLIVPSTLWSLAGMTITFVTAPSFGQDVYASYMISGAAPSVTTPTINEQVEFRALTAGEVAAKQLTLAATPADSNKVMVDVITIGPQYFPTDYTVALNILNWNGLGMDGLVVAGDLLRIHYFS